MPEGVDDGAAGDVVATALVVSFIVAAMVLIFPVANIKQCFVYSKHFSLLLSLSVKYFWHYITKRLISFYITNVLPQIP